jgi:hypothetical protein
MFTTITISPLSALEKYNFHRQIKNRKRLQYICENNHIIKGVIADNVPSINFLSTRLRTVNLFINSAHLSH